MSIWPWFEEASEGKVNVPGVIMVDGREREDNVKINVGTKVEDEIDEVSLNGGNNVDVSGNEMKVLIDNYGGVVLDDGEERLMFVGQHSNRCVVVVMVAIIIAPDLGFGLLGVSNMGVVSGAGMLGFGFEAEEVDDYSDRDGGKVTQLLIWLSGYI